MDLLQIEHVSKEFEGHRALDQVSFSIKKGAIVGLVGHNGAGKTTLIRIITQITGADTGVIKWNGESINSQHTNLIGYLPEERGLYKKMKVLEQLIYLGRLRGLSKKEAQDRSTHWLQKLDIEKWGSHILADLSKGMQQKVQFIAAILHEPQFLILDEPFSGFDPVNADLLTKEILELNRMGMTILFSTHQMESIEELCKDIVMINRSKCVYNGTVNDLKKKYATQFLEVEAKGNVPNDIDFKSVEKTEFGYVGSLKNTSGKSHIAFLSDLFQDQEIISFREKSLSMREIFLAIVKQHTGE